MVVKSVFSKLKSFITHPQYLLYSTMAWRCSGQTNTELVENLFKNRIVQTTRVKDAMLKVNQTIPSSSPFPPQPWRNKLTNSPTYPGRPRTILPPPCLRLRGQPTAHRLARHNLRATHARLSARVSLPLHLLRRHRLSCRPTHARPRRWLRVGVPHSRDG